MPDDRRRDYSSVRGVSEGMHAHATMDDWTSIPKFVFRLITLPIWLPFSGWRTIRRRRQMAAFAEAGKRNRFVSDRLAKEVTLDWVKAHPDDYVLGEYDPRVPKLQRTFSKLLSRRK